MIANTLSLARVHARSLRSHHQTLSLYLARARSVISTWREEVLVSSFHFSLQREQELDENLDSPSNSIYITRLISLNNPAVMDRENQGRRSIKASLLWLVPYSVGI